MDYKVNRIATMLEHIAELDARHGRDVPRLLAEASLPSRSIEHDRFVIGLHADTRMTFARQTEATLGETRMHVPGCMMIEVKVHGARMLVVNVYQGRIEIYHHKPGEWEHSFGSNPAGDTLPILPGIFAQPKCPHWQAFKESPEYQWPPQHGAFGVSPTNGIGACARFGP